MKEDLHYMKLNPRTFTMWAAPSPTGTLSMTLWVNVTAMFETIRLVYRPDS